MHMPSDDQVQDVAGKVHNDGDEKQYDPPSLDLKCQGAELIEEELTCIACGKHGCLLVCYGNGCCLAVHEKCLPSAFDEDSSFYCPRCSYQRAVTESMTAKNQASLAKHALLTFIGDQKVAAEPITSTCERYGHFAQSPDKQGSSTCAGMSNPVSDKSVELKPVNQQSSNLFSAEIDISDNCLKTTNRVVHTETSLHNGNELDLEEKEMHIGPSSPLNSCSFLRENGQTSTEQVFDPFSISDYEVSKWKHVADQIRDGEVLIGHSSDKNKRDAYEGVVVQPQASKTIDSSRQHGLMVKNNDTAMADDNDAPNMSTKRKRHTKEKFNEREKPYVGDSDISDYDNNSTTKQKLNTNTIHKKKGVLEAQGTSSNSYIRSAMLDRSCKGRQNKDAAPTSPKTQCNGFSDTCKDATSPNTRRRINWTSEEVKILKEGVQKFAVLNKKIPWGRILEYGSRVFCQSRSAVDLKDKWRKLAKES